MNSCIELHSPKNIMLETVHFFLVLLYSNDHRPKTLCFFSAHAGGTEVVRNKRGQEKQKPSVVHDYNYNMSGVDRKDQVLDLTKTFKS